MKDKKEEVVLDEDSEKTVDLNVQINNEKKESLAREINLDELYDGAVNNTVIIDPVTNDEVIDIKSKPNFPFIGVVIAIATLLILYYVTNKSDIGNKTKEVASKTTSPVVQTTDVTSGVLSCNYELKSETESQKATLSAIYENNLIKASDFSYAVVLIGSNASIIIEDLSKQYETLYVTNTSVKGNEASYVKDEKGFTFTFKTDYNLVNFNSITAVDGKTVLFRLPKQDDTMNDLKEVYVQKGYTCTLSD
ncbi:MAG: hypothetical protein RSA10_03885 [Bacilli bacterium]